MESRGKSGQRIVLRYCRPSRMEDELWAMAYERIWPLARRVLVRRREGQSRSRGQQTATSTGVARRA